MLRIVVVYRGDIAVINLDCVEDKCIFMNLVMDTGFVYASSFHISKEYD